VSVFSNAEATPSRVVGVYRYLLRARGQRESKDTLERLMMPEPLLKKEEQDRHPRSMVRFALLEGVEMRLFQLHDDEYAVHPDLLAPARTSGSAEARLGLTFSDLILTSENSRNQDLAIVLSWYLSQDVGSAPGDWTSVERQVVADTGEKLGLNDASFGQVRDWSRAVGLAWAHDNPAATSRLWLVPDPTAQIRWRLPEIFGSVGARIRIQDFVAALGRLCPVLETGVFREQMEARLGVVRGTRLSTTTAFALLRLQDEGVLELTLRSDADAMILPDGSEDVRISEIAWKAAPGTEALA
jgi:hypothetical protein